MTFPTLYEDLPDYLEPVEVAAYFGEVLEVAEQQPHLPRAEVADALFELAARQWHTYRRLEEKTAARLEAWLLSQTRRDALPDVEALISLTSSLGLERCARALENWLAEPLPWTVRQNIEANLPKIRRRALDPWAPLKS